jgi:hypothetical protein
VLRHHDHAGTCIKPYSKSSTLQTFAALLRPCCRGN